MKPTRALSVLAIAALATLAACSDEQPEPPRIDLPAAPAATAQAAKSGTVAIEGWAPQAAVAKQTMAPEFSTSRPSGEVFTREKLRGRWTILAFWGLWSEDSISEVRYMQALNTAAGQDPDLDFMTIHIPPPSQSADAPSGPYGAYLSLQQGLDDQGAALPTAEDHDGAIAQGFGVTSAPTYLLIGPDLTIEARRGALNVDDTDGIKPMIRGVAEIRKQIAAP